MNKLATFFRESQAARFLIPLGILCIIVSIAMFIIDEKNKDYIKVEATVSRVELYEEAHVDANDDVVDATYTIYVKYTVDEKEYETELGIMPKQNVGDKVNITYNPEDPTQISQPSSFIVKAIILGVGVVALVGGICSAVNAVKKHKAMKEQEKSWANGN